MYPETDVLGVEKTEPNPETQICTIHIKRNGPCTKGLGIFS